ncbi:MAG: transposase [Flavobacteriales bacterium Tduv]
MKHDRRKLKPLINKLGYKPIEVYAEKGEQVPANVSYFHSRGIKYRIQKKVYRNHPLSRDAILFNKLVSKPRWVVERTFSCIKRWFGSGKVRYKKLIHVYAQHIMDAMDIIFIVPRHYYALYIK